MKVPSASVALPLYLLVQPLMLGVILLFSSASHAVSLRDVQQVLIDAKSVNDGLNNPALTTICASQVAEPGYITACRRVLTHAIVMVQNPSSSTVATWVHNSGSQRTCNATRRFVQHVLRLNWSDFLGAVGTVGAIPDSRYTCR